MMWLKEILIFTLIILALSCSDTSVVKFGFKGKYQLSGSEKWIKEIDRKSYSEFERYCCSETIRLLLNRVIIGDSKVFISMLYNSTPKELIEKVSTDTNNVIKSNSLVKFNGNEISTISFHRFESDIFRAIFYIKESNEKVVVDVLCENPKQLTDLEQSPEKLLEKISFE